MSRQRYYRARYYDPRLGRFLSEDPIAFQGGDVNLYAYVWNDPANWVDALGLQATPPGKRRSTRAVAVARAKQLMKDPETYFFEQCFAVCQRSGQDPFYTSTFTGTAQSCPPQFCPAGAAQRAFCHIHPWNGGYQGHSPRWTGGQDFYWPDSTGALSFVGQGGNVWEYDPKTKKETKVCCAGGN